MDTNEKKTFVTACPGCGKHYRLSGHLLGKEVRCKQCQHVWRVKPLSHKSESGDTSDMPSGDSLSPSQLAGTSNSSSKAKSSLNESGSIDVEKLWLNKSLGRFQVTDVLGKGAMGIVFKAHDPDLKRDVAVKILEKQFIKSQKRTYRLEQFVREARSAARLSHPNSVTVFEIGQDQGWYFIAMEIVSGGTLLDLVRKKKKKVPLEIVCEMIAQSADALSAAHKLGIIHRDIKPSNLMITTDGRVKVADFGLAQLQDATDDFELPTKAVGTPYWMSPEQCKGETAIPQSDIYSLGAVLYFALTGEVPFKGKTKRDILAQHLSAKTPDPREIRKGIPESLYKIILRAMAKNPAQRFQDAAEMAIALRNVANSIRQSQMAERWWGQLASSGATGSRPGGKKSASLPKIAAILILLAGIIGGIAYFATKPATTSTSSTTVKPVTPAVPEVPVYVIKGTRTFHAKGCPLLKNIPADRLTKFKSDKAAEAQGLTGCRYCTELLKKQKAEAKIRANKKK